MKRAASAGVFDVKRSEYAPLAVGLILSRREKLRLQLADEIATGVLEPGTPLDEQELARRFGVSRTPVREAICQLAASGLSIRVRIAALWWRCRRRVNSTRCFAPWPSSKRPTPGSAPFICHPRSARLWRLSIAIWTR